MPRLRHSVGSAAMTVLMLLASACAGSAAADGPPEINYGRDLCVNCGMIISEERFAAAYRLPDGTERIFDDLGGLIRHGQETGELDVADVWVHDYETEEWVAAEDAHFIVTRSVATPMAFGIVSFGDEARAAGFAHGLDASVVSWAAVRDLPVAELVDPGDDHDDHDHAGESSMNHDDEEG